MQSNIILLQNYRILMQRIDQYNDQYNGQAELLLVSKNLGQDQIKYILANTEHRIFGENRVQNTVNKWSTLKKDYPNIKLHLIGKLQSNKVKLAVRLFDVIETIDSVTLASKVIDEALQISKKIQIFLQINIANEPHKNGVFLKDVDDIFKRIRNNGIHVAGIMCIPPIKGSTSAYFQHINQIAKKYKISKISMGMSTDFQSAIEHGSTQVRIGSFLTTFSLA